MAKILPYLKCEKCNQYRMGIRLERDIKNNLVIGIVCDNCGDKLIKWKEIEELDGEEKNLILDIMAE